MANPYTKTIDFTARGQRIKKEEAAQEQFSSPDPPLKPATPATLPTPARAALKAIGWPSLLPVQAAAIPYLLQGRDLIVQSRTGSGKTGAFLLPLFSSLDPALAQTQALVVTPTRELARQIYQVFSGMNAQKQLRGALVYGGVGYQTQVTSLKEGAHLVVGTPGRILDHLGRKTFSLRHLKVLVLDEADEMLSMGFLPDIQALVRYMPRTRHSYMFSATMPPKVRTLGSTVLSDPAFLGLSEDTISVDTLQHVSYRADPKDKPGSLIKLLEFFSPESAIVFANTRSEVTFVAALLRNYGLVAAAISGDLSQQAREKAMRRLRKGQLRILVATDVAARGIDISELSHVIQYDVPEHIELYIHRTGRTARAGREGTAITLTTFEDESQLDAIARYYALDMEKRSLPTDEALAQQADERAKAALERALQKKSNLQRSRLERFIPLVRSLSGKDPALLAMLVDEMYHRRQHGVKSGKARQKRHDS